MEEYSAAHARHARVASGADEASAPTQATFWRRARLSLGADGANQNGVAAEGACDTRPFSGEGLQGLRVAL